MPRVRGRRLKTCHHEAGHALVRWYFGFATDRAVVLTVEEVRAGRRLRTGRGGLVSCEGMVSGTDILPPPYGPRVSPYGPADQAVDDRWRAYRRDVELIDCYAGFHAEARYGHVHATAAALTGGDHDMAQFRSIMAGWFPGDNHADYATLEGHIIAWTRALIRSPRGSRAIRAIAEAIQARGRLSGSQIATLCRKAYDGRECAFEAWAERWPPTLQQLREGYIPGERARPEAGTAAGDPYAPEGQVVGPRACGPLGVRG